MDAIERKGFTIFELIVLLAAIATVAFIAVGSFERGTTESRDRTRLEDIAKLRQALKSYYSANHTYPARLDTERLVPVYIEEMPLDPKSGKEYAYAAKLVESRCADYHLGAVLEEEVGELAKDADLSASARICAGSASDFSGKSESCAGAEASETERCYDVRP
ncbi:type II secretion system GspH family protein [Candidatus Parcubacteria bacterium]|nr:type II secretion system GspH family protein [Candidatus Parcubacteria bacterium]